MKSSTEDSRKTDLFASAKLSEDYEHTFRRDLLQVL